MEDAVKALEYAFAMLVFVIALTASIYMLSKVKTTSEVVFSQIDTKQYYTDVELPADELNNTGRIVNIQTIVPTLYRDYKENYIIEFYNKNKECIIKFDLSEENRTRQIWTGNPNIDIKKRLDLLLKGENGTVNFQTYEFKKDTAIKKPNVLSGGLYKYCEGKTFVEEYAYVPAPEPEETNDNSNIGNGNINLNEQASKIVIRYTEI